MTGYDGDPIEEAREAVNQLIERYAPEPLVDVPTGLADLRRRLGEARRPEPAARHWSAGHGMVAVRPGGRPPPIRKLARPCSSRQTLTLVTVVTVLLVAVLLLVPFLAELLVLPAQERPPAQPSAPAAVPSRPEAHIGSVTGRWIRPEPVCPHGEGPAWPADATDPRHRLPGESRSVRFDQ